MTKVFFSIIIPTLNEEDNLPVLLKSLVEQDCRDFEVIIADSGSKDKTKNIADEFKNGLPDYQFLEHLCKNVSMARNFGAKKANGEYLIFFDADGNIESKFLTEIKEIINKEKLDCMTVWNRTKSKNFTAKLILFLLNTSMSLFQKIKPGASGTCLIINKKLFDNISGFNEEIVFGEDFNLIQKAHQRKAKFAVYKAPIFYTSTRRFEKEGLFLSLYKSLKALVHQIFLGPIIKPIFEYEMGGQYYKKENS